MIQYSLLFLYVVCVCALAQAEMSASDLMLARVSLALFSLLELAMPFVLAWQVYDVVTSVASGHISVGYMVLRLGLAVLVFFYLPTACECPPRVFTTLCVPNWAGLDVFSVQTSLSSYRVLYCGLNCTQVRLDTLFLSPPPLSECLYCAGNRCGLAVFSVLGTFPPAGMFSRLRACLMKYIGLRIVLEGNNSNGKPRVYVGVGLGPVEQLLFASVSDDIHRIFIRKEELFCFDV